MKIGIWKRIVLACKLLLGFQILEETRALLAHEITPLQETIKDQSSRLDTQAQQLHTFAENLAESCAREEKRLEELEDLTASIDAKIGIVERLAEQEKARAVAEKERDLRARFEKIEAGFAEREEQFQNELASAVTQKAEELSRAHTVQLNQQVVKAESALQSVLFELRGGGGEDDRYSHDRAYEFCKNLSPKSCKSLRHIVKIESRLAEAENTVRLHLRESAEPEGANSPVKTGLPIIE